MQALLTADLQLDLPVQRAATLQRLMASRAASWHALQVWWRASLAAPSCIGGRACREEGRHNNSRRPCLALRLSPSKLESAYISRRPPFSAERQLLLHHRLPTVSSQVARQPQPLQRPSPAEMLIFLSHRLHVERTQVGRQAQHMLEIPSCSQTSVAFQVAEVEAPKSTGKRKAAAKSNSGDATGAQESPAPLQLRKRPKQAKQAPAVGEDSAPSAAAAGAAETLKPVAGLPGVQQRVQARPGKGDGGQLPRSDSPAGARFLP